ncbi:MAG: cyclic nucleotide-binding domain-containing protein [Pseudomonadota bacterium]
MGLNHTVDVLREVSLFRNVDPKQLRLFAFMGETLTFRAGERLFEKGDEGDAAYVVIDGAVEVLVPTDDGEASVAQINEREIFGEMAVLCDQERSTAIAAKCDVTVLRLERAVILNLLQEFPDIALEMIKVLAARLEATTNALAAARA